MARRLYHTASTLPLTLPSKREHGKQAAPTSVWQGHASLGECKEKGTRGEGEGRGKGGREGCSEGHHTNTTHPATQPRPQHPRWRGWSGACWWRKEGRRGLGRVRVAVGTRPKRLHTHVAQAAVCDDNLRRPEVGGGRGRQCRRWRSKQPIQAAKHHPTRQKD